MIILWILGAFGVLCYLISAPQFRGCIRQSSPAITTSVDKTLLFLLVFGVALLILWPGYWVWIVIGIVVVVTARRLLRQARLRQQASRNRAEVSAVCRLLNAQISMGTLPSAALRLAGQQSRLLGSAVGALDVGVSVADELAKAGEQPGATGLKSLAAAWDIATRSGAPFAPTIAAVNEEIRQSERSEQTVQQELASALATGRLLAALPVAGIGMGYAVGGAPVQFLAGTLLGQCCLVLAVVLVALGLLWTEHIATPPRSLQ